MEFNAQHTLHGARRTFVVSELECFDRCPHEYYLKYILGLPATNLVFERGQGLPANVIGSIIHGALEQQSVNSEMAIDDIIAAECMACNVRPTDRDIRNIKRLLDSAHAITKTRNLDKGYKEINFDWKFEGRIITGTIDWLLPTDPHEFEILDFKTDKIELADVPSRAREYDLQMVCYAMATEAATGKRARATTLLFVAPEKRHTTPFTDERRCSARKRIGEILAEIEKESYGLDGKKAPCYKCPYHHNSMCWMDQIKKPDSGRVF